MPSPLEVKQGDSLNLLSYPEHRITIPLMEVYQYMGILEKSISQYKASSFGRGLYFDISNIRPTIRPIYDPTKVDELTRQVIFPNLEYELYPLIMEVEGTCMNIRQLLDLVKKASHPVSIRAVYGQQEVMLPKVVEANFYPTDISIALELVRDALQAEFFRLRPWMHKVLRAKPEIICSSEEREAILNVFFEKHYDIVEIIEGYPHHLIAVIANKHGLVINVLCDIRIYLWTQQQELSHDYTTGTV